MEGLPHARGGVSQPAPAVAVREGSSPRSWGCFQPRSIFRGQGAVFPTLVGVFPERRSSQTSLICLPHARGGVSVCIPSLLASRESSPRSWGCFCRCACGSSYPQVFPTLVGVFLRQLEIEASRERLPHARGGVSSRPEIQMRMGWSSPRSWGCFLSIQRQGRTGWVFPTLVGVFPSSAKPLLCSVCLPHARGGVSRPCSLFPSRASSSPRSWGCFCLRADLRALYLVFPTLVGVFHSSRTTRTFRRRLPHARGGVSAHFYRPAFTVESSPRSWGCFRPTLHCRTWDCVFPTLVGVFPDTFSTAARQSESSPRSWGCFPHIRIPARRAKVFPTLVGVFPSSSLFFRLRWSLPHARGGVSHLRREP